MGYNLGIDIGITSIGFAGVNNGISKILCSGVHIFEAAENPKDGASLAAPRREKRGMRRVVRRRAARKNAVRQLLLRHGLNCLSGIDSKITKNSGDLSPWDLRRAALERRLTDEEFVRVLFHIAKRRGFQSNKKSQLNDNSSNEGKALKGASDLEQKWIASGEKTIGAYLAAQRKKRNGDGSYDNFLKRDWLREEIKFIFEAQRNLGQLKATEELRLEYSGTGDKAKRNTAEGDGVAFFQRSMQSSENLIGECTFEKGEKRAPKFSYTAELFILWSKLNNLKIRVQCGEERFLMQDEKNRLSNLAHKNKGGLTYAQARKELGLDETERFNISYLQIDKDDNSWEKIKSTTEKAILMKMAGFLALQEALDTGSVADWQKWMGPDRNKLDEVAYITSFIEDGKIIREKYEALGLNPAQIENLCSITNFSKTVDISLKALRKIVPEMQKGLKYHEACEMAGYNFNRQENKGLRKVPKFDDVRNPVVNRALAQARKVINACIREHGMPDMIIVELAREVGKPKKSHKSESTGKWIEGRDALDKKRLEGEAARTRLMEELRSERIIFEPTKEDALKYRLWKEQEHICFYCGSIISMEQFRDGTATQIDHIIPYSKSWDDSYMNKTLCHASCNQIKGNRIPYEVWGGTSSWNGTLSLLGRLPKQKAERISMQSFDDKKSGDWKDRALNDTRYMARLLKNHLENNLNVKVQTRNGSLTAHLRGVWGFAQKNRENDRHHALDAIILAVSSQGIVQRLSEWNKYEARRKNPAERPTPPKPWDTFREDTIAAIDKIFVSRMPVRKITGAAHQGTIRSIRRSDGKIIQRLKLKSLTLANLEAMVDKDRNFKLYLLLKGRLEAFGGKADKAFAEPVYMPVNDPKTPAPRVNSIRIVTSEKSGIKINEGLASNGDMVRIDVFKCDNKFWLVPIYVHHFAESKLPNKAIIAFKDEAEWQEMDDQNFLFSLYKNDLIKLTTKKEVVLAYYTGTDRSTGAIGVRIHDGDPSFGKGGEGRYGVKSALNLEKFTVDYFGRISKVGKEKRLGVADSDDSEASDSVVEARTDSAAE